MCSLRRLTEVGSARPNLERASRKTRQEFCRRSLDVGVTRLLQVPRLGRDLVLGTDSLRRVFSSVTFESRLRKLARQSSFSFSQRDDSLSLDSSSQTFALEATDSLFGTDSLGFVSRPIIFVWRPFLAASSENWFRNSEALSRYTETCCCCVLTDHLLHVPKNRRARCFSSLPVRGFTLKESCSSVITPTRTEGNSSLTRPGVSTLTPLLESLR